MEPIQTKNKRRLEAKFSQIKRIILGKGGNFGMGKKVGKVSKFLLPKTLILVITFLALLTSNQAKASSAMDISMFIMDKETNKPLDGDQTVSFIIYEGEDGSEVWSESQSVRVSYGLLKTSLGEDQDLPENLDPLNNDYYLGIKIGNDKELSPRKKISPNPFAISAISAQTLQGSKIGEEEGDIMLLGSGGKIDNDYLNTGEDDDNLILGNDDRLHNQNEDTGTTEKTFTIGSETSLGSNNFTLAVGSASSAPALRYNAGNDFWELSDNGTDYSRMVSKDYLGGVDSSIVPSEDNLTLGTPDNKWERIYVDFIDIGTISVAGTISGFLDINTDADDGESSGLRFYRGSILDSYAALYWDETLNKFNLYENYDNTVLADLKINNLEVSGTVDGKDIATNAAMLNENETITADWDNSANPWSDSEVVDSLTIIGGSVDSTTTIDKDPVITLGGDLSGNVTLSDLSSGILAATITANSIETGEITNSTILAVDLNSDTPADGEILVYNSVSGGFEWIDSTAVGVDTHLTESEVEAYIFDADNTGTLSSGTLALSSLSYTGTLPDTYLNSTITRDSEWDSVSELETAISDNLITASENNDDDVSAAELDGIFTSTGFLKRTGLATYTIDSIIDFSDETNATAGTGISITGDSISSTLGTAIDTNEITNSTILATDLNSDVPANGEVLVYNSTNGGFIWTESTGVGLTYYAGGTLMNLSGTTFSINEGVLTDGKLCTYDSVNGLTCNTNSGDVGVDTYLSESQVEAYIFDADNTGTLSSGTLALSSLSYTGTLPDTYLNSTITRDSEWDTISELETILSENLITASENNDDDVSAAELDDLFFASTGFLKRTGLATYTIDSIIDFSDETNATAGDDIDFSEDSILLEDDIDLSILRASASAGLSVYDDSGNLGLFVQDGGNVGIGTGSPSEALEVNGNIKLTTAVGSYGAGRVQAVSGGDLIGYTLNSSTRVWDLISITSSATDYFAIRDNTAGFNRLVITEDGNAGIGTGNPSANLHVLDSPHSATSFGDPVIKLNGAYVASGMYSIGFGYGNTQLPQAEIGYKITDGAGQTKGDLVFGTRNVTTDTAVTERMRITSDGNVGIGTTSPSAKLDVNGDIKVGTRLAATPSTFGYSSSYKALVLGSTGSTPTSDAVTISLGYDPAANPGSTFSGNGNDILFRNLAVFRQPNAANTNFLNPLTLNNGNVGIGTTSPSYEAQIIGTTASNKFYASSTGSEGTPVFSWTGAQTTGMFRPSGNQIAFTIAGSEAVRIDDSGNVGIGTTSPGAKLEVVSGSSALGLNIQGRSSDNTSVLDFSANGLSNNWLYRFQSENAGLSIRDRSSNYFLYLEQGGNVGIGTTSPGSLLTVEGGDIQIDNQKSILGKSTGGSSFNLISYGTAARTNTIMIGDESINEPIMIAENSGYIYLNTNGNVGIGTTSPGELLDVSKTLTGSGGAFTDWPKIAITQADNNGTYNIGDIHGSLDFNAPNETPTKLAYIAAATTRANGISNADSGLYFGVSSGNTAASYTNPQMVLDHNGNVGIGTTSPQSELDVRIGTGSDVRIGDGTDFLLLGESAYSTSNNYIGLKTSDMSGVNDYMIISGKSDGATYISAKDGEGVYIRGGGNDPGNEIIVYDSGSTDRIDIDTTTAYFYGDVGIGTSSPGATLDVAGRIDQTSVGYSVFLGRNAGLNDDLSNNYNVFIGDGAGYTNTTGDRNTFVGRVAGYSNSSGVQNTFLGYAAGYDNTTGSYNTLLGYSAGENNTGSHNTFLGHNTGLSNTSGGYNTFIGRAAGASNTTTSQNTFVGYMAGYSATGGVNTFVGYQAGYGNTIGIYNTYLGVQSGYGTTSGNSNAFLGYESGFYNTTGTANTYIGRRAGRVTSAGAANQTTTYSTYLGYNVDSSANGVTNEIAIGYNAIGQGSNSAVLGNGSITKTILRGFVGVGGRTVPIVALDVLGNINFTGVITDVSDSRLKENMIPLENSLEKITQLQAISFNMIDDEEERTELGFTAQNVQEFFPEAVSTIDAEGHLGLAYDQLIAPTIHSIQTINSVVNVTDAPIDSPSIYIDENQNVGIGDTSPSYILTVDHNGDGTNVAYVNDSNAWTSGSADYAEYYKTTDKDLEAGEAVCIDIKEENTVERCSRDGDSNIMGIVSTNPAFLGNAPAEERREDNNNYTVVAMLGQVPAKVSTENGEINPGDSLSAAETSGFLKKANPGESTVGVALEQLSVNPSSQSSAEASNEGIGFATINVLISRKNKSLTVSEIEDKVTERVASMEIEDEVDLLVQDAINNLDIEDLLATFDERILTLEEEQTEDWIPAFAEMTEELESQNTYLEELTETIESTNDLVDYLTQKTLSRETRIQVLEDQVAILADLADLDNPELFSSGQSIEFASLLEKENSTVLGALATNLSYEVDGEKFVFNLDGELEVSKVKAEKGEFEEVDLIAPEEDEKPECIEENEGKIYYDKEEKSFMGCDGKEWNKLNN